MSRMTDLSRPATLALPSVALRSATVRAVSQIDHPVAGTMPVDGAPLASSIKPRLRPSRVERK